MSLPYRSMLQLLLCLCVLTACTQSVARRNVPRPTFTIPEGLDDPQPSTATFPVAAPVSIEQMIERRDPQINQWLKIDSDAGIQFGNTTDIQQIPDDPAIAVSTLPPSQSSFTAQLIGPDLVPYEHVGRFKRDWVESAILPTGARVSGAMWLGGSFHVGNAPTHDLLVTVLLDYQQVDFSLGGRVAHAHLLRIPRDKVLIYDFSLPHVLPEGEHVISIVVNWDPWRVYTTRAVRNMAREGGRLTWSTAGPVMFDALNISNKYVRVGQAKTFAPVLQPVASSQPLAEEGGGGVFISRGKTSADPIWRHQQALAVGEPGRLYAYINYQPFSPDALQPTHAVLIVFLDDRQIAVNGVDALFFAVEADKQYQVPIDIDVPNDGQVHALYASVSFMPFLPSKYFDAPRPQWMHIDSYESTVVPLVPDRSWIAWLPPSVP